MKTRYPGSIFRLYIPTLYPDAIAKLFAVDLCPRLDAKLFAEPNAFRTTHCYLEQVDTPLRRHEEVLRSIFAGIPRVGLDDVARAKLQQQMGRYPKLGGLISLPSWMGFLRALQLFDVDLAERDAQLAFGAARMAVVDGESDKGQLKDTMLPFEGFLEALCRLSVLKALPTREEVISADFADAGHFLLDLKASDLGSYNKLLKTRGSEWPGEVKTQPMGHCVEHLVQLMVRSIEVDAALARVLLPAARHRRAKQ